MTDNIVAFPFDKAVRRSGEPVSYDGEGKRMQLFAYDYVHGDKSWGMSLWAYSWEDAEARIASINQSLALGGQIVSIIEGEI